MTTTAFTPTVPHVQSPVPAREPRPAKRPEVGGLRVLMLDADDSERDDITEQLRREGFDVIFADDHEDFMDELAAKSPDALVLDTQKDPSTILQRVRAQDIMLPVVIVSDDGDASVAGDGLRPSIAAVLRKPFGIPALAQQLRRAIGEGRLAQSMHLGDAGCPFELPPDGVDLEAVERGLLAQALVRTNGNQSRAARLLGISRYALRYRMQKFKLA